MQKSLKALRYLIIGGLFTIPFIPLIVSGSLFFPFISGKNFYFRILIEIIFGAWAVLAIYDKRYRPKMSWILGFLAAFIISLVVSSIFGENPYHSFWSNYERMEGVLTYFHIFAYFIVLISVFKTEKLWKWFFNISLGVSAIVGIYGVLQLAGKLAIHQGSVRLDATLGNASYLAIYMVFNIFIALFYLAREKEWYAWFYVPLVILQLFVLYHTATRGAILGIVGGLLLAAVIVVFLSKERRTRIFAFSAVAFIVLSSGLFLLAKDSSFVKNSPVLNRFASISMNETTTQSRFVIWGMAWKGFKEKPIIGWGPENFNLVFDKYYEPILYKQEPWFDRAHNVFFGRLIAGGVIGLFTYLGLFLSAFYYLLFKKRGSVTALGEKKFFSASGAAILAGLLFAYFFNNLFVFDNLISSLFFFAVLAYIHVRVAHSEDEGNERDEARKSPIVKMEDSYQKHAFASLILVAVVFGVYNLNVPSLLASRALLASFEQVSMGNAQGAFDEFQKAISYNSFGSAEAREQLVNFASKVVSQENIPESFKNRVFLYAVSQMKQQIKSAPGNARYLVFLASLYNKAGRYDSAIELLKKALEISPKRQIFYFELVTSYINKGEIEKAIEAAKKAFELEPSFGDARQIYALTLIYGGKTDLAEKLIRDAYGSDVFPDQRFVSAYIKINRMDRVAEIWKKLIKKNPKEVRYRMSLAATYFKMGEKDQAVKELEKVIELNPQLKTKVEGYIKEIRSGATSK